MFGEINDCVTQQEIFADTLNWRKLKTRERNWDRLCLVASMEFDHKISSLLCDLWDTLDQLLTALFYSFIVSW